MRGDISYLPVYKLTFYGVKIGPKNRPRLIHGSKTEIKKSSGQISKSERQKKRFSRIFLPRNKTNSFFGSKTGGGLIHGY